MNLVRGDRMLKKLNKLFLYSKFTHQPSSDKIAELSSERRLTYGNFQKDKYEAIVNFSENNAFEVATILLKGAEHTVTLKFPYSHFYRVTERQLSVFLYPNITLLEAKVDYPIYKIENSLLIEQVVYIAGGVLDRDDLAHYQVLSQNLVVDIILYAEENIIFQNERGYYDELD